MVSDERIREPVDVRCDGGIGWVWLNRPERRNAISLAMREMMQEQLAALDADDEIRVVVVTGVGAAFCAGVDLKERTDIPSHVAALRTRPVSAPFDNFGKPIIAAINGPAVGGGLELALAADMRIASTAATFALPEVGLGSLPGSGGTQRLVRVVSPAVARKLIFSGEPINATQAHRSGLISDLVAPDELIPATRRLAESVAQNSPLSLRAAKLALSAAEPDRTELLLERALWGVLSVSEDRAEGRAAFREHRKPRFTGA